MCHCGSRVTIDMYLIRAAWLCFVVLCSADRNAPDPAQLNATTLLHLIHVPKTGGQVIHAMVGRLVGAGGHG